MVEGWGPRVIATRGPNNKVNRLLTEGAGLLEAKELLQGFGHERRPVWFADEFEECIGRYGSPTGIL
jgi:hypothetical protein